MQTGESPPCPFGAESEDAMTIQEFAKMSIENTWITMPDNISVDGFPSDKISAPTIRMLLGILSANIRFLNKFGLITTEVANE